MVGPNDEVDACPWCGDPSACDERCVADRLRQEEANAAILRLAEARVRKAWIHHGAAWLDFDVEEMFDSYVNQQVKAYKEREENDPLRVHLRNLQTKAYKEASDG